MTAIATSRKRGSELEDAIRAAAYAELSEVGYNAWQGRLTLEAKQKLTQQLLKAGATIHQMNAVRKHLSAVKGGRLAAAAQPAAVCAESNQ